MFHSFLWLSILSVFFMTGFSSVLTRGKPHLTRISDAKLRARLDKVWVESERFQHRINNSVSKKVRTLGNANLDVSSKNQNPGVNSSQGLNSNNYIKFTFNTFFNSSSNPDLPESYYNENGPTIRWILDLIDAGLAYHGYDHSVLVFLQSSLLKSFEDETGAVFYSIETKRWMFCGWLDLFLNQQYFLRLCAKLTSFGLPDITRSAVPMADYITQSYMEDITRFTARQVNTSATSNAPGTSPNPSIRDVIDVDLENYEETYETNCLESTHLADRDCYAFCCNSYYMGSAFCTDFPVNCI